MFSGCHALVSLCETDAGTPRPASLFGGSSMAMAEQVGLSSQRLKAFDAALNARYVASGHLPGAVTLI